MAQVRMKRKRYQEEQRKETEKFEQEKAKEKVELDIKKTKLMKEDLQKLCLQLEKDFENLMSKASEKKISTSLSSRGCFFEKNKR